MICQYDIDMFAEHLKEFLVGCDFRRAYFDTIIVKNMHNFLVSMRVLIHNFSDEVLGIA